MWKFALAFLILLTNASVAHADPISAIVAAVSAFTSSISAAIGGLVSFASVGAFLASPIGGLVLGIGLQLLVAPLFRQQRQTPSMEAGKVNVRLAEPERWLNAGRSRQGGGVVFCEFDANGNLWYVIAHSDTPLLGIHKYYMDDEAVTLDADGWVSSGNFIYGRKYGPYEPGGALHKIFRVWVHTFTRTNPVPSFASELKAAFPGANGWTDNHKLVGVTYSVIMAKPVSMEYRYKVYKWKGPIGLGEPSFSIVGHWAEPYDPRTGTYGFTRNSALIWAWFRTHKYGRGKSFDSINWERIAEQANICDQIVNDKDGNPHVRYQCGAAIPESKERSEAEQEILISCDGQIVFDDDGKVWVRVGYYYMPTLTLHRNRDIFGVESVEAQDGESETQGVVVRYIDPDANFTAQPSAPWKNPLYYVEGQTPRYLTIDALGIQDHNQAMRLAKSVGLRSQSEYKLLPTTGLRGVKARQERIIDFAYDNNFAGPHEIVTPVEVDESGVFCGFGIVPVDENRWILFPDEEASKPVFDQLPPNTGNPSLPTSVIVSFDGSRISARFDPSPREDWRYEFEYKLSTEADDKYIPMSVDMEENIANSGGVQQNKTYNIRWQAVASSGRMSGWVTPVTSITTVVVTVSGTPVLTAAKNVAYAGFDVNASGGQAPYFFVDLFGRLPPGIAIDAATGVVSGTPTTDGEYADIILRVQDAAGAFNTLPEFTITVAP